MYSLPTSVQINGELFKIRDDGDFRVVLHCFEVLNADDLNDQEKIISSLMLFYKRFDEVDDVLDYKYKEEAIKEMFKFINCGQEEKDMAGKHDVNLVDWEKDSLLITSAINHVAGKEIRAEKYLHWWTFIGYYMAIGECALSQIVGIRYKIAHGQKLEKHEKKFKQENPQYFNIDLRGSDQKQADNYIQALWDGGDN